MNRGSIPLRRTNTKDTFMNSEDQLKARLEGKNCLIKFVDGEELYVYLENFVDDEDACSILADTELFLSSKDVIDASPIPLVALNRSHVKYIRKI